MNELETIAWKYIAENDENANIIIDGKIHDGAEFLVKFINYLRDRGDIFFKDDIQNALMVKGISTPQQHLIDVKSFMSKLGI